MSITRPICQPLTQPIAWALGEAPMVSGGGAAVLPAGAAGVWYADQFSSSPRMAVPNAQSAEPLSQNLLHAPRRLFNNNDFWVKNGATVTDGPTESAVTLAAGDSFLFSYPHAVLPAGTYTIAATVRRAGGTDQTFQMTFLHAGEDSGAKTATETNQRFTFTATVVSGTQGIIPFRTVAGAAADLIVSDVALYSGSLDIGEPTLGGHLYLGENQYDTKVSCADGVLDLTTADSYALAQFPSDLALSEYTCLAVGQRTNDSATYSSIMGTFPSQTAFCPMFDSQKTARAFLGGQDQYVGYATTPNGLKLFGSGWKVIAHRFGARRDMFINDTHLISQPVGGESLPATVRDLMFGAFTAVSLNTGYKVNAIVLYDRALTDNEMVAAYQVLVARASASSLTVSTAGRYHVAVGDSITVAESSYAHLYATNANPKVWGAIYANAGGTLPVLETNAALIDAIIPASETGSNKYILSVMIGTSDLTADISVAQFLIDLASYLDDRMAAGWIVVICTLLPRTDAGFLIKRNAFNAAVNPSWIGVHCHALCDMGGDPTMGPDAASLDTGLYLDGTHPTAAGQAILETVMRPILNAL